MPRREPGVEDKCCDVGRRSVVAVLLMVRTGVICTEGRWLDEDRPEDGTMQDIMSGRSFQLNLMRRMLMIWGGRILSPVAK